MSDGYDTYFRFKTIIEIIGKEGYSVKEIVKMTGFPQTSVYRTLGALVVRGKVKTSMRVDESNVFGRKQEKIFKLKNKK